MLEQSYPISCPCRPCGKLLYGPVKFCPYCGTPIAITPIVEASNAPQETAQSPEQVPDKTDTKLVNPSPSLNRQSETHNETPSNKPTKDTEKIPPEDKIPESSDQPLPPEEDETKLKGEPSIPSPKPVSWGKWISGVAALLIIISLGSYLVFQNKGEVSNKKEVSIEQSVPRPPPKAPKQSKQNEDAKRETARVLALEALRQGTDLSVSISKLPKLEKVLQAAKDLQEISPRYQDQVTAARDTLDTASKARDKSLMAYLSKAIELGRYTPDQVSYAMGIIKNGDPTPREKIVLELLSGHIRTLSNSPKPDSAKMLSSFTQRFSNFVD